jgi:hypothetical protein
MESICAETFQPRGCDALKFPQADSKFRASGCANLYSSSSLTIFLSFAQHISEERFEALINKRTQAQAPPTFPFP